MNKIYRIGAVFNYFCVAKSQEEALEQFADYCEFNHIQAKHFDEVYFDGVAKEVPEENE